MEVVTCPVCGEERSVPLWSKWDATYVRCIDCRLVYENPRFTQDELIEFYSRESYFMGGDTPAGKTGYANYYEQCTPELLNEYYGLIEHISGGRRGHFLDVGCGPGGLVKLAGAHGWNAVGQEISRWAVQKARQDGLNIIDKALADAGLPEGSFDVISMFDVLEHLPRPGEVVREIFRILKPGGRLLIETPNIDGFFAGRIYKEDAEMVKPRAHICLYGPGSARRLLSSVLFAEIRISTFPYCRRFSLWYLKNMVKSRLIAGMIPMQLTLNDSMRIICTK